MSVGQQGCMNGRCNICVASSDHVSPFFLNAKSTGAKNTIKGIGVTYARHEENKS